MAAYGNIESLTVIFHHLWPDRTRRIQASQVIFQLLAKALATFDFNAGMTFLSNHGFFLSQMLLRGLG
jgi:hypothetical protein